MAMTGVGWSALGACAAAVALFGFIGCDQRRIDRLEPGVSTEADVRREFGAPAAVFDEPGGARTLDYPRQPEGLVNYLVTIGADGRMAALRQVLQPANFARVAPGMDREEVRRLLGKPAKTQRYALKRREEWTWRWADGPTAKEFGVVFDDGGRVVSSAVAADTRNTSH